MAKLNDIVTIRTGSPEINESHGRIVSIIRMKTIDHQSATINWERADNCQVGNKTIRPLANDDILIVSKGENNTAVLVRLNGTNDVIASNHFFVLSIKGEWKGKILPEYLTWFLNNPARAYLHENVTGAVISNLRKEVIADLDIVPATISLQQSIIWVYNTMMREKRVFEELFNDRMILLGQHILNSK